MRKSICLLLLFGVSFNLAHSQEVKKSLLKNVDSLSTVTDSTNMQNELKTSLLDNIPVIAIDDNEVGGAGGQSVSSALTSSRDPFISAASFNFSAARFRTRGYDGSNQSTYINGVSMENLDNGFTPFGLWGGLNDLMHYRDMVYGLRPNTFSYGEIGSSTQIDTRAGRQRKQTQVGMAFSNRTFTHRFSATHNTGFNKNGWAFSFSGSRRWSDEGYVEGTYYNGWSYFIGVDKKLSQRRTLSLVIFGAPTETGGQRSAVAEIDSLGGGHYYNPGWGYQSGKKRNANVLKTNQPYIILTDETKFNNTTSLVNAASLSFGDRSSSTLDWYNAANPAPDYYKYLPSYYADNPGAASAMRQQILSDVNRRQINWQRIYDVNRSHQDTISNATVNGVTGQTVTGKRSNYVLGEYVTNMHKLNFTSTFNKRFSNKIDFAAGFNFQSQNDRNYKRINDLLGGQYFVDLSQFAIQSFPTNPSVAQPNLLEPNKVVKVGDQYSYDYDIHINKVEAWSNGIFKIKDFELFVAGQLSNTQFWRNGNAKTGLYPDNSLGKSAVYSFDNFGLKGGITYKFNWNNYIYLNGGYQTKAPDFRNVFISPRTRDQVQENLTNENITSFEGGFVMNYPIVKLRVRGYYTRFADQLNIINFFNDDFYTFTNYAMSNIAKVHYGAEIGFDANLLPHLIMHGAASIGRYYFDSRQNATVVSDNTAGVLSKDIIYTQNYRIPNTPQEAYSLGLQYRSPKYWYVQLTSNYFDQMWANFNPLRRTVLAVSDAVPYSKTWNDILAQQRLPGQFTLDLNAGYSWKMPSHFLNRTSFLLINATIDNLTNNKNIVTGGGEQLRFDLANLNTNKFPPKYFYAYGLNYSLNITLRF